MANTAETLITQVPSTPPPARTRSAHSNSPNPANPAKSGLASPPRLSTSMTPPPSTQPPRFQSPVQRSSVGPTDPLLSPPTTIKYSGSTALPTSDIVENASFDDLKTMVNDLIAAVKDARTSAAHFKLQYSLLAMETQEAAQRAEVEHQMTKREVEVLQASEQRHRAALLATPQHSASTQQPQLEALTKTCKSLEDERNEAEGRLNRAKKLIELEKDKVELLMEEKIMLKKRIRENREHFTRLRSQSPIYGTPRDQYTTPQRRGPPRFPESSSNIAALLAADQVLSGEVMSVPSTPTKSQVAPLRHGHSRGAHSLSSLHTTPVRPRAMASEGHGLRYSMSAPGSQLVNESAERERHERHERHERDSTISISDADEDSDMEIQHSQASDLATEMLRKNPASQESLRLSQSAQTSSHLLQTKLLGNVKKPGIGKRRGSFEEDVKAKKTKYSSGVGLGIEAWHPA
ncbi:hypothetical protein DV736_g3474, partial [Chaetothyriales sp. CBS 134916]